MEETKIKLTHLSHGAGCGCKLSSTALAQILAGFRASSSRGRLLVGNDLGDDAAVYDLGDGQALVATTDFFTPIVDDPKTFGRIAAANALSDVYAMGGEPMLALSILGWPINVVSPEIARLVLEGAMSTCEEANVLLAGGHSIESPEPIFGLAVNGLVRHYCLKRNSGAQPGDVLFLTKALGVGLLTTAEKRGQLNAEDCTMAPSLMTQLNRVGAALGRIEGVTAMTDVTGFGLMGHLLGMCRASNTSAEIDFDALPLLSNLLAYVEAGTIPGGTQRNLAAYGRDVAWSSSSPLPEFVATVLADPQTSGGLLVAVRPDALSAVLETFDRFEVPHRQIIGRMGPPPNGEQRVRLIVHGTQTNFVMNRTES